MNKEVGNIQYVNSIFQQPWWLDAVAPDSWDVVEILKDNRMLARLPYVVKKKFGLTLIMMPPLTQVLGAWLIPSTAKYAKQLAQQKDLMTLLIQQIPKFDYFRQDFHYSFTNWLPFYWQGFTQTTRYTYVLENLTNLDLIWAGFRENIRGDIRKAQKQTAVGTDLDLKRFIDLVNLTFKRQGKNPPYDHELMHRLDTACVQHQARRIFFAEDSHGKIHAAIYLVWDDNSAYYLMGGSDPELRNSGATSLLMWEAIQFAATVTNKFDFEGSMIESVERFFRAFGARQVPYFRITKMSRRMRFLMAGREIARVLKDLR